MDKKVHYRIIIFTFTMWVLGVFFMKIEIAKRFSENPLDDCNLVYLDTNFGLQIR